MTGDLRPRYLTAARLPGLLSELARSPRWTLPPEVPLDPLWEEVSGATFDSGDVPDTAYSLLPALVDLAIEQGRTARDTGVVIGYVVDATLGPLPGACDIPPDAGPRFLACLATCRRLAASTSVEGLTDGEVSVLASARLLSASGLVAAYAISASRSEVQLVCPGCQTVLFGDLHDSGWEITDAKANALALVPAEASTAWRQSVADRVEPFVATLAAAARLSSQPTFVCPGCATSVSLGQALAAAVGRLPVARYSRTSGCPAW